MSANIPDGYNTVNPFIITTDALTFIKFLETVFEASERPQAHTMDTDGLLLHAELEIGNSVVMVGDRKEGWPFIPGLLQVYVSDVAATLQRAEAQGARIVTQPTEVYGDLFSRFVDPWHNLWWVYQHQEAFVWEEYGDGEADSTWATESNELQYVHETLLETMKELGKN